MSDAFQERRLRLRGVALMCGAIICFSCLDTTAKYLTHHMDSLQVVWARYTSAFLLTLIVSNPLTQPGLLRTNRLLLHVGRGVLLLGSTAFNFIALRYLQLDQALSIIFSTPFLVAALAGPMLGEWVGWRRWIAIGIGFLGVLVVTRPGFGGIHPAALLTVVATICYAFYIIATRVLSRSDTSQTTLFYSNLVGAVLILPAIFFVWTTPRDPLIIVLMVAAGALGSFGHYLLILAHRLAPASALAPFIYTQLVWAIMFGYFVFSDLPNQWTLAGATIVVGSGLYLLNRERVRGSRSTPLGDD